MRPRGYNLKLIADFAVTSPSFQTAELLSLQAIDHNRLRLWQSCNASSLTDPHGLACPDRISALLSRGE
jgi:hypothetical protein